MNDIDIVVNNAGILDERRWEREIAVNIVSNGKASSMSSSFFFFLFVGSCICGYCFREG